MRRVHRTFVAYWRIPSAAMRPLAALAKQTCRILLLFFFVVSLLFAGGPTTVVTNGVIAKWDTTAPVPFIIDLGPLGIITNEEGTEMVRTAFQTWEDLSTASITFSDQGFLAMDITDSEEGLAFLEEGHPDNPIIFDNDGKLTAALLGAGTQGTVAGFTSLPTVDFDSNQYVSGFLVVNGALATLSPLETTRQLITHEIGHLIGLDHTQAGHELAQDPILSNNQFVPVMYPILLNEGPQAPTRDDIAWLSWLYPEPGFADSTGTITGKVLRRTGGPFQGANVVAVQVDSGLSESLQEVVSVVSDFLVIQDGSFELPGLTPGDYFVFIEPLGTQFTGGKGIGPFDARFVNFVKDYYNGASESGSESDDPQEKMVIQVAAGQTVQEIDLVSNETINDLDALGDDDEMTYEFPAGFLFPFFGKGYTEVVVNSDGNLTFGGGDSQPGAARSEQRFLSGLPRIAPLFTDLDPGRRNDGKDVKATASATEVTFSWENVPEFTEDEPRPGNHFSVTLFLNGDIRFRYETIDVTPDLDDLQAIVGITPGDSAPGNPVDLSSEPLPIVAASSAIYEVFTAESAFDLTGREILFNADGNLAPTTDLLFPFYQADAQNFAGYALTNFSSEEAQLQVQGRDLSGTLLPFPDNPSSEKIASQKQTAKLGNEFFNASLSSTQEGWIRILSDRPEIASFFQFGNGLAGPLTKMDGSVSFATQSNVLYFTRLYQGPASFRGIQDAQTVLSIANPNNVSVTLTFKGFSPMGTQIGLDVERTLPAQGMLFESPSSILSLQSPVSDGFVRVDVSGPGAVGFELIQLTDTLLGLNASFGNEATQSYSAQLANGTTGGSSIFTSLKVVNTANVFRAITLTAYRADGSTIGVFPPFVLNPNQTFQRDVNVIFGLGPNTGAPITGSIRIEADGPGVIGDVIFGDPVIADFAAAMPLQTVLFRKAIFSQVANGPVDPPDRSLRAFTGIALFNPNQQTAMVTVKVFDRDGNLVGSTEITLGPTARLSDLVENLIPDSLGLVRGYIVVESTLPLVAQQLFGNITLKFLSAVPPFVVN